MAKATKGKPRNKSKAYHSAIFDALVAVAECEAKRPKRAYRNGVHWNQGYSVGVKQALKSVKQLLKD